MATGKKRHGKTRHRGVMGAPPGTVTIDPDSSKPVMHLMAFNPESYTECALDSLEKVAEYRNTWAVTWINIDGLGDAEVIRRLGELFHLHNLALEDVVNVHQRPKAEDYGDHYFLVLQMLEPGLPVRTEQVSVFFGPGYVITLQEHVGDCLDIVRKRIREGRGRVRSAGADYLAYCLFDAVLDAYFPVIDELSDRMEALEEAVVRGPAKDTVAQVQSIKRDLITIRRVISSSREAVNVLIRETDGPIEEATRPYLRDCYDHTIQILDMVETHREIVGSLLDVYLTSVSNHMNEIMKVLTIMATMFIPLSFLAGVYGMNFDSSASPLNMPELHWRWGYPVFLLLAASIALGELYFFWRRGWIGTADIRALRAENSPERERGNKDTDSAD